MFPSEGTSEHYCPTDGSGRSTGDSSASSLFSHQFPRSSPAAAKGKVQMMAGGKEALVGISSSHVGFIVLQSSRVKKDVSEVMGKEKRKQTQSSLF